MLHGREQSTVQAHVKEDSHPMACSTKYCEHGANVCACLFALGCVCTRGCGW